jgi:hypothetical protein
MARVEKEHEMWFLERVAGHPWLPRFTSLFGWGRDRSFNAFTLEGRSGG